MSSYYSNKCGRILLSSENNIIIKLPEALDESNGGGDMYYITNFFREIMHTVHGTGVDLSVCVSTRNFPTVSIGRCLDITLDSQNGSDIMSYVEGRIQEVVPRTQSRKHLVTSIEERCLGVFLWAALVVDDVLRMWDEGRNIKYLLKHLKKLLEQLDDLFTDILDSLSEEENELAMRLFYWAILNTKPLRLREWHLVMAFIKKPAPLSLQEWRASDEFTEYDEQLIKQVRNVSRGLVEVRSTAADETGNDAAEATSTRAGAGSLSLGSGETRVVQDIHESVREFFLNGARMGASFEKAGHVSIMMTFLDYLRIAELDGLVNARISRPSPLRSSTGGLPSTDYGSEPAATDQGLEPPDSIPRKPSTVSDLGSRGNPTEPAPHVDVMQWLRSV